MLKDEEDVAKEIVDACIQVHRSLGPGLMESAYQACLSYELHDRGLVVERELELPVFYRGREIKTAYRIDMLVHNLVLIENNCVKAILPIHQAQLITYLRMSGIRIGFLINWNVPLIKQGIRRMISSSDRRTSHARDS